MNLRSKKQLAAKTLGVGKNRIIFNINNIPEIKEAITKQDIKTLFDEGIISIKPKKGRRKIKKRKTKKGPGKIKIKVNKRKQEYVKLTRKLRKCLKELKSRGEVNRELYYRLRTKIKTRAFKSRVQFKEYIGGLKEEKVSSFHKEKEDSKKASLLSQDNKEGSKFINKVNEGKAKKPRKAKEAKK